MFWSDRNSDRIYRAWLNGTGATVLINSGLSNTCMVTKYNSVELAIILMFLLH